MNISLLEAWKLWISGQPVVSHELWGLSVLWWGRLGKVAEFAAATTIVADVIGPERLRVFGQSLHGVIDLRSLARAIGRISMWNYAMLHYLVAIPGSPREKAAMVHLQSVQGSFTKWTYIIPLPIAVTAEALLFRNRLLGSWWRIPLAVVMFLPCYGLCWALVSPVLILLVTVLTAGFGLVLDAILIEPFAWALDRNALDRWIKISSVLVLILGFHFDLLAS